MVREQGIRSRITEYLLTNGPVVDPTGKATAVLRSAVGYSGTDAGFIQVVASMANGGGLVREIKGKRTLRIETADRLSGAEMDFDELAAALLVQVTRASLAKSEESISWARRRLEQLETRNAALQRELARANADVKATADERDLLVAQLEATQHNLSLLTERAGGPVGVPTSVAARLEPDDQMLLHQMQHGRFSGAHS